MARTPRPGRWTARLGVVLAARRRSLALVIVALLALQVPDARPVPTVASRTASASASEGRTESLATRFAPRAAAGIVGVAPDLRELTYEAVLTDFPVGSVWRLARVVAPDGRLVPAALELVVLRNAHRFCARLPEVRSGPYWLHFENADGDVVVAHLPVFASVMRGQYRPVTGDTWGSDCRHAAAS